MSNETGEPVAVTPHTSRLTPSKPTREQAGAIDHVRRACDTLRAALETTLPQGRERTIALTKLQEAELSAIRAITQGARRET